MYSADIFSKEVSLSRTKVTNLLREASSTCFTVEFTSKVDEKIVKQRLESASKEEL